MKVVGYLSFHELFLEIAIPTYARCFREDVKILELKLCIIPRDNDSITYAMDNCHGAPVLHPLKLSEGRHVAEYVHRFMYMT